MHDHRATFSRGFPSVAAGNSYDEEALTELLLVGLFVRVEVSLPTSLRPQTITKKKRDALDWGWMSQVRAPAAD